jgi:hypothetical protein
VGETEKNSEKEAAAEKVEMRRYRGQGLWEQKFLIPVSV